MLAGSPRTEFVALVAVACIAFVTCPSRAADATDSERVIATELFKEGRSLLAEKQYAEACPKLEESERLDPGGGTLLNLALCHELAGRTATAWAEFHEALAVARRDGRDDREEQAQRHIASLVPRLARLIIAVPPEARLPDLVVYCDRSAIGPAAWEAAVPVDPGLHVIEAKAPHRMEWRTSIDVRDGKQETIQIPTLDPVPLPAPLPMPPPRAPAPLRTSRPAPSIVGAPLPLQRRAALALGGLGLVEVGLGALFGLEAHGQWADAQPRCAGGCDDQGYRSWTDSKRSAALSTLAFALGGVAVAGGVALWFTVPSFAASVRVGATADGVRLQF